VGAERNLRLRRAQLNLSYLGVTETRSYNANSQLASINWANSFYNQASGSIQYSYPATQNNGQIKQAADSISGETTVYQYDALKRLTSASNSAWNETFSYDGFGNLTGKTLNGTLQSIPVSGLTNQLMSATYDSNGNMTSGSGATIAYNEDNRMSSAVETSGGAEYYYYTPDGKRFWRQMANGDTQYTLYGAYGEQLGTWGFYPQDRAVSVNFGGRRIWQGASYNSANGSAGAIFPDRIGSNRYNDAATSTMSFYPYGDEITSSAPDQLKFATYTRDSYTGFDYADQRFYASTYGRFNTPDPFRSSAKLRNPLSWNRYSYTAGDPINRNDPSGLLFDDAGYDNCGATDPDYDGDVCPVDDSDDNLGPPIASVTVTGCSAPGEVYTGGPNGTCDQPIGGPYVGALQQVGQNSTGIYQLIGAVAGGSAVVGAGGAVVAGYLGSTLTTLGLAGAAAAPLAAAAVSPQGQATVQEATSVFWSGPVRRPLPTLTQLRTMARP
jgi:RHS repeat-associated protein